jgi:Protein of unknown function (DUF2971)
MIGCVDHPDTLYHYTNSEGLLGILKERALHVTSLHCLNDSTEFSYAFHVTQRITEELSGEYPGLSGSVKSALETRLRTFPWQSRFVACFSEEGDSLNQWRAYAGQGGVALGFSFATLEAVAKNNDLALGRCIYTADEHKQAVLQALDTTFKRGRGFDPSTGLWSQRFINEFLVRIRETAATIKHESFRQEREWRLVTPESIPSAGSRLTFRSGFPLVALFITIALAKKGEALPISEVRLGPASSDPLAKAIVRDLLASHGCTLDPARVRTSEVPYRRT